MDNRTSLKISAVRFMEETKVLDKYRAIAIEHSLNCRRNCTPLSPLILDLEIHLDLLSSFSNDLSTKIVEYPDEGRRILRESLSEFLENYLLENDYPPIAHVELSLRCEASSLLGDATGLMAKSYCSLGYLRRQVLTSVTVSSHDKRNQTTICTLTRCADSNCPGYAGKYKSIDESNALETLLDDCEHCGKRRCEEAAGCGVVRKVMARFSPVVAFNYRQEKSFHASLLCSAIGAPVLDKLELGEMYDIWGRYAVSVYEIWGLKRTSFSPAIHRIALSLLPSSIENLWKSFGETGPNDPWSFARILSLQLGSRMYDENSAISLKMALLLSLASTGNERCASILCVGPNIGRVEEDVMRYAANCADRNIAASFPVHAKVASDDKRCWLHGGSLLKAKTGVYDVGDWESLETTQKNHVIQALDDGYIVGEKNAKSTTSETVEFLSSPLPLRTAVWAYFKCENPRGQPTPTLQNLTSVFGIPFLCDVEELTEESMNRRMELFLSGGQTNPPKVPMDQLIEYLRIINGLKVSLSEEAITLMKDYYVASRTARKNVVPPQSITFMTTLAQAHARLSLRAQVTYDDVVAIIYLYEESLCFLCGYSLAMDPSSFFKQNSHEIGKNMESLKTWLNSYLSASVL